MPATDWREITFSRTHLRPHDGLDPEVRPLRRKAVELAKKKQIPAYMEARRNLDEAEHKERFNKDKIRTDEIARQSKERENLGEALRMRSVAFDEEWAHKLKEMERIVIEKQKGFEEKVEGQMNALNQQIAKREKKNMKLYKGSKYPPVIYSSVVRDDRTIEYRQAQAGNMELAIRYNNSLKNQMQYEKKRHEENCENVLYQKKKVMMICVFVHSTSGCHGQYCITGKH